MKFLISVVPFAASSIDKAHIHTPYSVLTNKENSAYDYSRRLMLLPSEERVEL